MADVGSTNIRLGAQIGGFLSGMRQASAATRDLTYQVNTNLTNSFRQSDAQARTFRGGLTRLGKDIQSVGKTMTGLVTLPAILGTGQAYKDFANLEKLEKGLDRFGVKLETVREIAKLPNIGLFDGAKIIVGLRSVNVETEKATRLVKAFGNAIAESGGSAADLEPAMNNIKEFFSTQKIDKVDLKEISARVPQMNAALMSAFGTTSTEALNKIGVEKVVEGLLVELEKIPPVAGGAQAAMDAMGDSATVASATFGKTADKVFDITGKINSLGAMLEKGADGFGKMSATGQKTVLAFGAIAAAAGPVLLAVGSLVKLWPTLVTGFAAMGGPLTVGIGLLAATVIYWNDIAGAITKATIAANNFFADAASAVGLDSYAARLRGLAGKNQAYVDGLNGIKYDPSKAFKLPNEIGKRTGAADRYPFPSAGAVVKGPKMATNGGNKEYWEKEKKAAEEALEAMGAGEAGSAKWREIVAKIQNADKHLEKYTISTKEAKEEADKLTKAQMELWRIDLAGKWAKEREEVKSATEEYKKLVGVVANVEAEKKKARGMNFEAPNRVGAMAGRAAGIADSTKNFNPNQGRQDSLDSKFTSYGFNESETKAFLADLPKKAGESVEAYLKRADQMLEINASVATSFESLGENVLGSFGEMLGGIMSGTNTLAQLPAMIGGVFGQMMKDLGKSFIQIAITAEIAKKALFSNPAVAIAAGVVLVAAGSALQNTSKKAFNGPAFAEGGFAYGDMMARVGDNPQARYDPEMIAPYSKVHDSIKKSVAESGTSGGGEWGLLEVKVRGEDIYHVYQRTDKRKRTIG